MAVLLTQSGCDRKPSEQPLKNTLTTLNGVYAPGAVGYFDTETIVIEGDKFYWWFRTDETLPNVFPLYGTFTREGEDLRLVYSIPGESMESILSVSPPTRIRVGDYKGITTLRTARYNDPFSDDLSSALYPTTIDLSKDRSDFPVDRSAKTTSPQVWDALKALQQETNKED